MVPVAGSAYTYAYATLGELFAWIIGWDLVLEYAVGAVDRRARLVALLPGASSGSFGIELYPQRSAERPVRLRPGSRPVRRLTGDRASTCRRLIIMAIITVILVIGIRESAPVQRGDGDREARDRRCS